MTDRIAAFTVVLEKNMRDDDVEFIINAIKAIKHVLSVKPHVAKWELHVAEERVRSEIHEKLFAVIYPDVHKKLEE